MERLVTTSNPTLNNNQIKDKSNNNKNIDDAGDVLRGELTSLTLDEALDIINNWRASHSYPLQAIKMMLRNRAHSIDKRPSSRND